MPCQRGAVKLAVQLYRQGAVLTDTDTADVTALLIAYRGGDRASLNRLLPHLYDQLRAVAHNQLRRNPAGETLRTTALVNEAYLKLREGQRKVFPASRLEFMGLAACVMRSIIVDKIRARAAVKRGAGADALELKESLAEAPARDEQVLALDEALETLQDIDERLVRLVECRFFAGYSGDEIAEILDCSRTTVQRDWRRAKGLLAELMG